MKQIDVFRHSLLYFLGTLIYMHYKYALYNIRGIRTDCVKISKNAIRV